jgi:hypothetical protein
LLLDSTSAYVRAAAPKVLAHDEPTAVPSAYWVRKSGDVFVRRGDPFALARARFDALGERITSLPACGRFMTALRADERAAPQIGLLVGIPGSWRQLTIEELCAQPVAQACAHVALGLDFEPAVARATQEFVEGLYCDSFEFVSIAPLHGVKYAGSGFDFIPQVRVEPLTDDEMSRCLHSGIVQTLVSTVDEEWPRTQVGLTTRFKIRKDVGGKPREEERASARHEEALAGGRLERALEALHVYKEGAISAPSVLSYGRNWPVSGGWSFVSIPGRVRPSYGSEYLLSESDADRIPPFVKRLERVRRDDVVDSACRRFSYAADRERVDDALVDLIIAAESLFLGDAGSAREKGEMRYRLALRAAFYLESEPDRRRATYDLVRKLYDLRSAIVHGGRPSHRDLRLGEDVHDLPYFAREAERVIRRALHQVIATAGESGRKIDWETVVFSDASSKATRED